MIYALVTLLGLLSPHAPAAADADAASPAAAPAAVATIAQAAPSEPSPTVCYSPRETRERVSRLKLFNPLLAMQTTARRVKAEPLRSRLCRQSGRLVYELTLLRRDGKVVHVTVNAQTGKPVNAGPS